MNALRNGNSYWTQLLFTVNQISEYHDSSTKVSYLNEPVGGRPADRCLNGRLPRVLTRYDLTKSKQITTLWRTSRQRSEYTCEAQRLRRLTAPDTIYIVSMKGFRKQDTEWAGVRDSRLHNPLDNELGEHMTRGFSSKLSSSNAYLKRNWSLRHDSISWGQYVQLEIRTPILLQKYEIWESVRETVLTTSYEEDRPNFRSWPQNMSRVFLCTEQRVLSPEFYQWHQLTNARHWS